MPAYLREHRNGSGVSVVFIHGETHEQVVAGPTLDIIQANEIRLACDKVELHVIQARTGKRTRPREPLDGVGIRRDLGPTEEAVSRSVA